MPWGALFDWDGVIIDSSRLHEMSWNMLAEERRTSLPVDFFKSTFGMKNARIIPDILGWTQDPEEIKAISLRKEVLYRELVAKEGLQPIPGIERWLKQLNEMGIPCVIGSSGSRRNIELGLSLTGLGKYFQGMVTSEDVGKGKPHPEVFLKAAEKAGRAPEKCVVFEDAHVGIEAAHRGGMRVVALATTHHADTLQDAHRVIESWDHLTVENVSDLFQNTD